MRVNDKNYIHTLISEMVTGFSQLVGLQKNVIIFIYNECKNLRFKTTESLTLEYISSALKCNRRSLKTTMQRLEKKGCLLRVAFKNGRGGWSKYKLPDYLYNDLIKKIG